MADLKLTGVAKRYGEVEVLTDINLEIGSGELAVLVGPSGCGKSTLLRMIAGLETISDGLLEIDGSRMNEVPAAQRGIAMVYQSYALYPHMSVRQNLAFALKVAGKPRAAIDAAVEQAAAALQLTPYLERLPKALSGGQRQRVAIGRAIVRDPRLYLFDEPLSNLDPALRAATRIEIALLKEKMPGSTMIYVTHDQLEAMTLASRLVVMNKGAIAQTGVPIDLYARPQNEFVAQFIGSPAMNLVDGVVIGTGSSTVVRLAGGGTLQSLVPTRGTMLGGRVRVGIRSEDLRPTDRDGAIGGQVTHAETSGEMTLLYLRGDGGAAQWVAKMPGVHTRMRYQTMEFTADPAKVHLFHDGQSLLYA